MPDNAVGFFQAALAEMEERRKALHLGGGLAKQKNSETKVN